MSVQKGNSNRNEEGTVSAQVEITGGRIETKDFPVSGNNQESAGAEPRTTSELPSVRPLVSEFALRDAEGDATEEVLTMPGRVYMLCVTAFDRLPRSCARRMARLAERAREEGAHVVCLTPDPLYGVTWHEFGTVEVRCYNIDASTMKTMLRADNGLVVLDDGTITSKKNCRDIRP